MTDNTPLNADDELRDNLWHYMGLCPGAEHSPCIFDGNVSPGQQFERIMEFILADRKKHELQARIDELSAIYGWSQEERTPLIFYPEHRSSDFAQMATNGMGTNFTVRERISELKAQQEEV